MERFRNTVAVMWMGELGEDIVTTVGKLGEEPRIREPSGVLAALKPEAQAPHCEELLAAGIKHTRFPVAVQMEESPSLCLNLLKSQASRPDVCIRMNNCTYFLDLVKPVCICPSIAWRRRACSRLERSPANGRISSKTSGGGLRITASSYKRWLEWKRAWHCFHFPSTKSSLSSHHHPPFPSNPLHPPTLHVPLDSPLKLVRCPLARNPHSTKMSLQDEYHEEVNDCSTEATRTLSPSDYEKAVKTLGGRKAAKKSPGAYTPPPRTRQRLGRGCDPTTNPGG